MSNVANATSWATRNATVTVVNGVPGPTTIVTAAARAATIQLRRVVCERSWAIATSDSSSVPSGQGAADGGQQAHLRGDVDRCAEDELQQGGAREPADDSGETDAESRGRHEYSEDPADGGVLLGDHQPRQDSGRGRDRHPAPGCTAPGTARAPRTGR